MTLTTDAPAVRALRRALPWLVVVAFVLWLGEAQAAERRWLDRGVQATYLATAAVGLNVLVGYTGLLSLGHASFLAVGAFAGGILAPDLGLDPWLGFVVAPAVGAATGAVLALLCAHLRGFYLTVVTLGFGALLAPLVSVFDSAFGGRRGRTLPEPLDAGALPLADGNVYAGLLYLGTAVLLVALAVTRNLAASRWGRALRAVKGSEVAAAAAGIPAYRAKVAAFAVSAALVGLGGMVAAQLHLTVNDSMGDVTESFRLVLMVAVGGAGTVFGPVIGAFGLTFLFGVGWVQDTFGDRLGLFLGGLAVLVTVVAPRGLVPAARSLPWPWRRPPAKAAHDAGEAMSPAGPALAGRSGRPAGDRGGPHDEVLLDVRGLHKRFGGVAAIQGLDLEVHRGTVHGLIGPNGSGKSTLVNLVAGIDEPSAGTIRLGGADLDGVPAHGRARLGLARTFQNLELWPDLTVVEHVMVGAHSRTARGLVRCLAGLGATDERRSRQRAVAILGEVGLAGVADRPATTLPFADQRRLEVARALACEPELVLLDEPAAGMHPGETAALGHLIARVRDAGITVVLIDHHLDLVMDACDVVTVLDEGRAIAHGPPATVRADPAVIEAYLGVGAS